MWSAVRCASGTTAAVHAISPTLPVDHSDPDHYQQHVGVANVVGATAELDSDTDSDQMLYLFPSPPSTTVSRFSDGSDFSDLDIVEYDSGLVLNTSRGKRNVLLMCSRRDHEAI